MPDHALRRRFVAAISAALALGLLGAVAHREIASAADPKLDALKRIFMRPESVTTDQSTDERRRAALGARLFRDPILSHNRKMACITCHEPQRAYTDGRMRARGNDGQPLDRNTPSLVDAKYGTAFQWDGRAQTLEAQLVLPLSHPRELNLSPETAVARLAADRTYVRRFEQSFPDRPAITVANLAASLAAFERTLASPRTRFDRWIGGEANALTTREIAGFRAFTGPGRCIACHGGWRFTDGKFHDTGLPSPDLGRGGITTDAAPHTFKTPTLRQLSLTAPYMHDGSLPTLESVVAHYAGGRVSRPSLASELREPIALDATQRRDLIAFLKTLSSPQPPPIFGLAKRTKLAPKL